MENNIIGALNSFLKTAATLQESVTQIQDAISTEIKQNISDGDRLEALKKIEEMKKSINTEIFGLNISDILNETNKHSV